MISNTFPLLGGGGDLSGEQYRVRMGLEAEVQQLDLAEDSSVKLTLAAPSSPRGGSWGKWLPMPPPQAPKMLTLLSTKPQQDQTHLPTLYFWGKSDRRGPGSRSSYHPGTTTLTAL